MNSTISSGPSFQLTVERDFIRIGVRIRHDQTGSMRVWNEKDQIKNSERGKLDQ